MFFFFFNMKYMTEAIAWKLSNQFSRRMFCENHINCNGYINYPWHTPHDEKNCSRYPTNYSNRYDSNQERNFACPLNRNRLDRYTCYEGGCKGAFRQDSKQHEVTRSNQNLTSSTARARLQPVATFASSCATSPSRAVAQLHNSCATSAVVR